MRSVVSRLARLEQFSRLRTAPKRLRLQYGYLKTLPDDFVGPRHVVTVKRIPPGCGTPSAKIGTNGRSALAVDPSRPRTLPAPTMRSSSGCATWTKSRSGVRLLAGQTTSDMNSQRRHFGRPLTMRVFGTLWKPLSEFLTIRPQPTLARSPFPGAVRRGSSARRLRPSRAHRLRIRASEQTPLLSPRGPP
jgi:hypothetical protein